ncbi:MAG: polyhydroxyalkanoic acid system family protein [Planctomycetota bacterium]|nr:polyhydroxyalkanoic acid system family protein [Planctomycetota bacterium]
MSKVSLTIEHTLGTVEAMRRIRTAAEAQRAKAAGFVSNVTWTEDVARVEGTGFSGEIRVSEREVKIDAELGFPASLMPMKIKKEAEAWLRGVLDS